MKAAHAACAVSIRGDKSQPYSVQYARAILSSAVPEQEECANDGKPYSSAAILVMYRNWYFCILHITLYENQQYSYRTTHSIAKTLSTPVQVRSSETWTTIHLYTGTGDLMISQRVVRGKIAVLLTGLLCCCIGGGGM